MKELSKEAPFIRSKGGLLFTTSIDVAEKFGKRHAHVLESVRKIIEESACVPEPKNGLGSKLPEPKNEVSCFGLANFKESAYIDEQNQRRPMYEMTRSGFGGRRHEQRSLAIRRQGFNGHVAHDA